MFILPLCCAPRTSLKEVKIFGLAMDLLSPITKYHQKEEDSSTPCNNIEKLVLIFPDDDGPQDFSQIPHLFEHFVQLQELDLSFGEGSPADVEDADWSNVHLPNLRTLTLACMDISTISLKQVFSHSTNTLDSVTFHQINISGGKWSEIFEALDAARIIKLWVSECDYCDGTVWDEIDEESCKDLIEHTEARSTARGLKVLEYPARS
jgi:hypothetical protein